MHGRYIWSRISERRQKKQFVKKLIMELEGIRKDFPSTHAISTAIYDMHAYTFLLDSSGICSFKHLLVLFLISSNNYQLNIISSCTKDLRKKLLVLPIFLEYQQKIVTSPIVN